MNTDPTYRGPIDPQAIFVIRWLAVAGQLAALLFTHSILEFDLPLYPALAVIGCSAIVNFWHIHAAQKRPLYQQASFLELGFDGFSVFGRQQRVLEIHISDVGLCKRACG